MNKNLFLSDGFGLVFATFIFSTHPISQQKLKHQLFQYLDLLCSLYLNNLKFLCGVVVLCGKIIPGTDSWATRCLDATHFYNYYLCLISLLKYCEHCSSLSEPRLWNTIQPPPISWDQPLLLLKHWDQSKPFFSCGYLLVHLFPLWIIPATDKWRAELQVYYWACLLFYISIHSCVLPAADHIFYSFHSRIIYIFNLKHRGKKEP